MEAFNLHRAGPSVSAKLTQLLAKHHIEGTAALLNVCRLVAEELHFDYTKVHAADVLEAKELALALGAALASDSRYETFEKLAEDSAAAIEADRAISTERVSPVPARPDRAAKAEARAKFRQIAAGEQDGSAQPPVLQEQQEEEKDEKEQEEVSSTTTEETKSDSSTSEKKSAKTKKSKHPKIPTFARPACLQDPLRWDAVYKRGETRDDLRRHLMREFVDKCQVGTYARTVNEALVDALLHFEAGLGIEGEQVLIDLLMRNAIFAAEGTESAEAFTVEVKSLHAAPRYRKAIKEAHKKRAKALAPRSQFQRTDYRRQTQTESQRQPSAASSTRTLSLSSEEYAKLSVDQKKQLRQLRQAVTQHAV